MTRALAIIRWLWWAVVAALPILAWRIERIREEIRACSLADECALLGSTVLFYLGAYLVGVIALLWPVCAWFLFVAPWRRRESK